jgi:hypothetical protein
MAQLLRNCNWCAFISKVVFRRAHGCNYCGYYKNTHQEAVLLAQPRSRPRMRYAQSYWSESIDMLYVLILPLFLSLNQEMGSAPLVPNWAQLSGLERSASFVLWLGFDALKVVLNDLIVVYDVKYHHLRHIWRLVCKRRGVFKPVP